MKKIKFIALFISLFLTFNNVEAQRSFGSGRSSSTPSRPSTPSVRPSTSSIRPPTPSVRPSTPSVKPSAPAPTKSFGSGTPAPKPSPSPSPSPNVGVKPKSSNYDQSASKEQHKAESKSIFENSKKSHDSAHNPPVVKPNSPSAKPPITTHNPPSVKPNANAANKHLDDRDHQINDLRNRLSEERLKNRSIRENDFYIGYYNRPYVNCYPYNNLFWYWMLDRSINEQALWAYHHRDSMGVARYNDLLSSNAELKFRITQLEKQNIPHDPNYKPDTLQDEDLMYDKEYVDKIVKKDQMPQTNPREMEIPEIKSSSHFWSYLFILILISVVVWLVFVKEWN